MWSAGSGAGSYTCYVGGDSDRFNACIQGGADYLGTAISIGGTTFVPSSWWDEPFTNSKQVSFAFKERTLLGNAPTYNFVAQPGQLLFEKMQGNNDPKIVPGGIELHSK
jgi:hypothetical protein